MRPANPVDLIFGLSKPTEDMVTPALAARGTGRRGSSLRAQAGLEFTLKAEFSGGSVESRWRRPLPSNPSAATALRPSGD